MNEQSRKWTPGPWHLVCVQDDPDFEPAFSVEVPGTQLGQTVGTYVIAENVGGRIGGDGTEEDFSEIEANAALIAEAGTVATETGLTPRQLAERVVELEGLLRRIVTEDDNCELDQTTIETARAALRTTNTP